MPRIVTDSIVRFRPSGRLLALGATFAAVALQIAAAAASDFLSRPVRLMVGFAAGGGTASASRLYSRENRATPLGAPGRLIAETTQSAFARHLYCT